MAVLLALSSSVMWGGADFLGGLLSRSRRAVAVVAGSQACGLVAVALVALVTGGWHGSTGWFGWSVLAGLVGASGLVAFYSALGCGTMGVVSPIAALGAVVPVLLGLVQGESPSSIVLVGLVLALVGVVTASGPELAGGAGARPVVLASVAGVCFGLALVFIERGAQTNAVMTMTGMRATSVGMFLVAAVVLRTNGALVVRDAPALAAVGVADVGANLLFALATQRGLLSVTAVLGSLYPVVTVLLARVVLHERLRVVQQVGVVAALTGVVLVSAG
ncbi:MAG TPA: DMT family transporter [Actinomycetales bacterium]|nr:DMT family transporter [Actinomycetales bacterium]